MVQPKKKKIFFKSDTAQAVMMISPMLVGFIVFTYLPILYIIRYCVYNYDGYNKLTFIGLDNFVRIFMRDPAYWESLLNTVVLSAGKLIIEIPLALLFAVLLNKGLKGSGFFRVMLFLPTIISTAIIGLIFSLMFSAYRGVINTMLTDIGLIAAPIDWFGSKWSAMAVLGMASIWCYLGINIIFFLMALQSVPAELYECAKLDGASASRTFFSITIPMIGPIFRIVLLNAIIGSLKVNDLVLASTNGQPGGRTEVVMTYVFKYFFGYSGRRVEVGYASAMAVVTGVFLGIITLIYLKSSNKMTAE
ncbi:MAG TPA: sugar ABC transporter permease [Lachnoclostridium sp.]|jgi:ABC-type sugar transport system permease subunit|uniref:carbohydrate ABC transporter permease n=1 Tax=Lacrimispora sp. TaxID=2719234 RepID=UPI000EF0A368|nr:sugar ABC transporter permease [Lacrimispora sp.]HCD42853.1 sugar ABC transporter permease [Lachnoclostridium sp.]